MITLRQAINKAYLKEKVARPDIERLKTGLRNLLQHIDLQESETNLRDHLRDFLNAVWYRDHHLIASKERADLVIHADKSAKSPVAALFEVKRPKNAQEMIAPGQLNRKAMQELVWYYLRERVEHQNPLVKTLVVTDIHTWFLFNENDFDRYVYHNKKLLEFYHSARENEKNTDLIYKTIGRDFLPDIADKLSYTYFDLRDFEKPALDDNPDNDRALIPLYKGLSPTHLLRLPFANDSNSLDKPFYHELLYIIGLEEVKEGGRKLIRRRKPEHRQPGALLENAIAVLDTEDILRRLPNVKEYGADREEQQFQVGLELVLTWVNRLLFLKLLESQLRSYHNGDPNYLFLHFKRIQDFDELNELFFDALAKRPEDRPDFARDKFALIPYLNSSLFEIQELESLTIRINSLKDRLTLPLLPTTVLKDHAGRRQQGERRTLEYLFLFLDAYDFSSEGSEEISEESKTLINASVLGLIFEKINGYRDGAFFTPGFITMYMCRETIRRAVVQKFNEKYGWRCEDVGDLKNHLVDRRAKEQVLESNAVVNSLKICDPAVGSGHFLVSALNEIIAVKSELGLLADEHGIRLPVEARIENDELIVTDDHGFFRYQLRAGAPSEENQRIQQSLFREKQRIIENCLFGVDINPNSVKICRLRLWIELLKNAYYTSRGALETLPNIDINIKQGNSLISRFALDADLSKALKSLKYDISAYKNFVRDYHRATDREVKQGLVRLINQIKYDFRTEIGRNDPKRKRLDKLVSELYHRFTGNFLFEPDAPYGKNEKDLEKKRAQEKQKLEQEIEKLNAEIEEVKSNRVFENAFEWRFEFPEVLDDEGRFIGFDVVVGNPPYMRIRGDKSNLSQYFQDNFEVAENQIDAFHLFFERAHQICDTTGLISLIIPNTILGNLNCRKLRQFMLYNTHLDIIADIREGVFDDADVEVLIIQASKKMQSSSAYFEVKNKKFNFVHYFDQEQFKSNQNNNFTVTISSANLDLLSKIQNKSHAISKYFDVTTGIKEYQVGKGNPPQSKQNVENRSFNSFIQKDDSYIPEIRGKNINKYDIQWTGEYISYGPWIAEPRVPGIFRGCKILIRQIPSKNSLVAGFTANDYIVDQSAFVLKCKQEYGESIYLKVLGLLNSRLMFWYFQNVFNEFDSLFPKIKAQEVKSLPVSIHLERNQSIESLVTRILDAKRADPGADTAALEAEIDQLVYGLYGLTEEEIAVVAGVGAP